MADRAKKRMELFLNIVFRKIADVKKEEEERRQQKNEVTLSIPVDHPVRKLFQKFKQQKEMRADLERNQIHMEHQLHPLHHQQHHYHQSQYQVHHTHNHGPPMQNGAPSSGGGSGNGGPTVVTVSQITPVRSSLAYVQTEDSSRRGCHEALELKPSLKVAEQNCLKVTSPVHPRGGGVGRGWMRLRNSGSGASLAPPSTPDPPRREEDWGEDNPSLELHSEDSKNQVTGMKRSITITLERIDSGSDNVGFEEVDENSALHKSESCDADITKSDLHISKARDSQSSTENSSMEQSLTECNQFHQPSHGVACLTPQGLPLQPVPDQALLQNSLQEAKIELKGDIQTLSGRLSVLEAQVGEILRLLSERKSPSSPPQTSTQKTEPDSQDIFTVSRPVTPDADKHDGPF